MMKWQRPQCPLSRRSGRVRCGWLFADPMAKHGVGVRVRATYTIQTVDEDYFGQEKDVVQGWVIAGRIRYK